MPARTGPSKASGPLKDSGLSHEFGRRHHTYFSEVTFGPQQTIDKFYDHINSGMRQLSDYVKADRIRLKIVAITFGSADAMIVWQAKDPRAAKAFRDNVLASNPPLQCVTLCCMASDGHG